MTMINLATNAQVALEPAGNLGAAMTIDLLFANDGEPLTVEDLLRTATVLDDAHVPDSAEVFVEQNDASRVLSIRVRFEHRTSPIEPVDF